MNLSKEKISLNINFISDLLLKVVNLIFPLLTFPYLARVLSPSGIGSYEFIQSLVNIFILIAQLGVPIYGVRLLSSLKGKKDLLTLAFNELLVLNVFTSLFSSILYFFFLSFNSSIDFSIGFILGLNILFSTLNIEWLYQALEKFSYITIRSIAIKVFTLILIFVFVRNSEDLTSYIIILFFSNLINASLNLLNSRKFLSWTNILKINFYKHLKPVFFLFIINVSISIYINLDKVMLGFLTSNYEVGIYTTATKLIKIIIILLTSYGYVSFPQINNFIGNGYQNKAMNSFNKIFLFISFFSLPLISIFYFFSDSIIYFLGGQDYNDSVLTLKILTPLLILLPLSNFFGLQILMAYKKEKFIFISTIIGDLINFSGNFLLIPAFKANGAALATVIAELSITLIQFFFVLTVLKIKLPFKNFINYFFGSIIIIPILYSFTFSSQEALLSLFFASFLSGFFYLLFLVIIKDNYVFLFFERFMNFINKSNFK